MLGGTHFSLDGVKLSANVSKEWSGTIDELKHKRDKLLEKLKRVIAEHAQADKHPQVEIERQKKRERRFLRRVICNPLVIQINIHVRLLDAGSSTHKETLGAIQWLIEIK